MSQAENASGTSLRNELLSLLHDKHPTKEEMLNTLRAVVTELGENWTDRDINAIISQVLMASRVKTCYHIEDE